MGSTTQQCIVNPLTPPMLPVNSIYTSCYCEENIYLLGQALHTDPTFTGSSPRWEAYAMFISNEHKSVALWCQKAAQEDVIVWDYHVVLVLKSSTLPRTGSNDASTPEPNSMSWVYDFDTRLPIPCSVHDYMMKTFPYWTSPPYPHPTYPSR